jgi:leucyl aminopeptidase (aminopeptidase T)
MSGLDLGVGKKVARKVLEKTLHVKSGENVTVETWNNGLQFARIVVREARRLGCIPLMIFEDEKAFVESAKDPKSTKGVMGKHEYALLAETDAYVFIPSPVLGVYSRKLKPEERDASVQYNRSWYEAAEKAKLRGARLSFGYVGPELATFVGKSLKSIVDHQMKASLVEFEQIKETGSKIASVLSDDSEISLLSDDCRLEFNIKGEVSVDDGVVDERDIEEGYNMHYVPPGHVAKQVEGGTANGKIRLSDSLTRLGVVRRALLTFKDGKLVNWEGRDDDKRILDKLLNNTDESGRLLSNVTIGLNPFVKPGYGIDRMSAGMIGVYGFGFSGFVKSGNLTVNGKSVVEGGKLLA